MTNLTRPVKRETAQHYRGKPLIIELHAGYLKLRQKGRRRGAVEVDYATILEVGYKLLARQESNKRAEEKAAANRRRKV